MPLDRIHRIDTDSPEWFELLKSLVARICIAGPVERVIVFGSLARNAMTEASDLDVLVVIPDDVDPKSFRAKIPSPLSTWPTDLIVVRSSRFNERKDFGGVLFEASRDGIELYPRWDWGTSK